MKTYLLSIFALLIVGCGNQRPQQEQAIFAHKLDSVKQAYIKALDSMRLEYANTTDSLIRIRYTNLIQGYRINVMWQPEYVGYKGKIIGKAIINFRKRDKHFSMVHSHYFLNGELGVADADTIQFDKSHIYEIEYPAQNMREDVPFFFDDHWHTLVFTMWNEGQRHTNAYRYYKVSLACECIQDDLYQITWQEPYTRIDDLSSFDSGKITILTYDGAFHQTEEIYQKNYSTDSHELTQIKEYIEDSVFTYNIEKHLINTELIKEIK